MTYNLTGLYASDSIFDLFTYANEQTSGILFGLFMVSIFLIMTFAFIKFGFEKALLVSSFISFVLSSILSFSGFLTIYYPIAFLAITAFIGLYVFFSNPQG
jgi:hypothetical protein